MSIFELEHIFIVFHPGAAGNFIASLVEKLLRNDSSGINIGSAGTAHTLINRKIAGTDYLSFGTEVDDQSNFNSEDERIDFYLEKIKTEYNDVSSPQVIWSHDFTNIPLYKKYFPNSKVIVITQETINEKLAVTLFNVGKNILDPGTINPLTEKRAIEVMRMWNHILTMKLVKLIGESNTRAIKKDSKLYRYMSYAMIMSYYGLDAFIETGNESQPDLVNTVLYPEKAALILGKSPYTVGKPYSEYTTGCVKLPFKYLMDKDINLLTNTLSQIIDLDETKKKIIEDNFNKYYAAQNQKLLNDPMAYYLSVRAEGMKEVAEITTNTL